MKTTVKYLTAVLVSFLIAGTAFAQTTWNLDKSHSNVKFTVTHLVISEVDGLFKSFNGTMTASKPDFTDAKIDFSVDIASISTDNEQRDGHLKSDDFFNAEKFPVMTFKSVLMRKVSGNKYELLGNLTIRDVTKPVKFTVVYGGTVKDPWGNTKAGFKATTTINRLEYGLKWNSLTEAGGAVVGPDVNITLNVEFAQAK
ncbi:MAG: polyisoprenoid-binding protein [Alphaproteobacteria bacterium]|nr:polyisoprenoid-binding protein [Alphaproteobacteria bacterium]